VKSFRVLKPGGELHVADWGRSHKLIPAAGAAGLAAGFSCFSSGISFWCAPPITRSEKHDFLAHCYSPYCLLILQ
jgi:hypothetical protein